MRYGKTEGGLKMDLNEGGFGVVAVGIRRGYSTTLHRKLDFTSPTEYRPTNFKMLIYLFLFRPLGPESLLLRGARLKNTKEIFGL